MCDSCGCSVTTPQENVEIVRNILYANDAQAGHNRDHFAKHGVLAVNLMSSPGAGKTSLLEATVDELGREFRIAVIEGDLETENDAARIRRKGVPALQINTGTACHLDAAMVHSALHELPLDGIDIVFIENVGNLVCPASFDLGQSFNVTLLSTPEGDDKPAKYPVMFRAADLVLISKCDLLDVLDDFRPEVARTYIEQLATAAVVAEISAKTGSGMQEWADWLRDALASVRAQSATA